jgi:hypothetical protein
MSEDQSRAQAKDTGDRADERQAQPVHESSLEASGGYIFGKAIRGVATATPVVQNVLTRRGHRAASERWLRRSSTRIVVNGPKPKK